MKKAFFLLFVSVLTLSAMCQPNDEVVVTHYLFPKFLNGRVLMKYKVESRASLNYNTLTQQMIFIDNGKKLALGQLDEIDTVYINNRKFIPLDKSFIELVYHSKYALFVDHKCEIKEPGKEVGYGGTSKTASTTSYSSILSGGQAYELSLPAGITPNPYTEYWLKMDGEFKNFTNVRQLVKLFGRKESICKEYVKQNDVKLNDQESIIGLVKYMEKK